MADPSRRDRRLVAARPGCAALLWAILLLFALFYLAPLYVMLATSLKSVEEIRAGNLLALPQAPSLDAWVKAWSPGLRRRRLHRHRPLLLQLGQDGGPGGGDLDHHRRAQRLRADQMDVQGREPRSSR